MIRCLSPVLVVPVVAVACSGAAPAEPPAQPAVAAEVRPEPASAPVPAPEAKLPEPDPGLPELPDGTRARPCGEVADDMRCIPGGPFLRGSDDGPENARPAAQIFIRTFHMDLNEVTYAQYMECVKQKKCPKSGPQYRGYDYPNMPITGISWYDAVAYCEAQGKRLPSEAEWEKAARGEEGALYSWGDEPVTCERAIIKDEKGRSCGLEKDHSKPETGRPWDVGSRPAGIYGLNDMIGNSWEWVDDWYASSYEECGQACTGLNPRGPCGGGPDRCEGHGRKIVRGGSWYWTAEYNTAVYRRAHVPSNRPFHHFGFRCAKSLPDPG